MQLLDFSSLLEIYAVFAFAYFGVDTFQDTINSKIFKSSEILRSRVNSINERLKIIEQEFLNALSIYKENTGQSDTEAIGIGEKIYSYLEEDFEDFNSLQQEFNKERETILTRIKSWKATVGFVQICLFSAIFCVVSLYLAAFINSSQHKDAIYLILFILSLGHIILSIYLAIKDSRKNPNEINFKTIYILYIWILIIILGAIYYLLFSFHPDFSQFPIIRNITVGLVIIAPISQYLSYFVRFLVVHKKARNRIEKLVEDYNEVFEERETISNGYHHIAKSLIESMGDSD